MALICSTARRYAEAAFEIAERDSSVDAWLAALAIADERLDLARGDAAAVQPGHPACFAHRGAGTPAGR